MREDEDRPSIRISLILLASAVLCSWGLVLGIGYAIFWLSQNIDRWTGLALR